MEEVDRRRLRRVPREDGRDTRKHGVHLRVPVTADEEAQIRAKAEAAGLSVAAYLRNVGLGYPIRGIVDNQQVDRLARINGDLGRLGGLLKMWLANDERLTRFPVQQVEASVHTALEAILTNQLAIQAVMAKVVR